MSITEAVTRKDLAGLEIPVLEFIDNNKIDVAKIPVDCLLALKAIIPLPSASGRLSADVIDQTKFDFVRAKIRVIRCLTKGDADPNYINETIQAAPRVKVGNPWSKLLDYFTWNTDEDRQSIFRARTLEEARQLASETANPDGSFNFPIGTSNELYPKPINFDLATNKGPLFITAEQGILDSFVETMIDSALTVNPADKLKIWHINPRWIENSQEAGLAHLTLTDQRTKPQIARLRALALDSKNVGEKNLLIAQDFSASALTEYLRIGLSQSTKVYLIIALPPDQKAIIFNLATIIPSFHDAKTILQNYREILPQPSGQWLDKNSGQVFWPLNG